MIVLWWIQLALALTPSEQADALALEHDDEVQACFENADAGRVELRFRVKGGLVLGMKTVEGDGSVSSCLEDAVKGWRFPTSLWGPVKVLTLRKKLEIPQQTEALATIRARAATLKICYDEALQAKTDLAGHMKVAWAVDAGVVKNVVIEESDLGVAAMNDCVVTTLATWSFPATLSTDVSYRFTFEPRAEVPVIEKWD